jgi:hypothetical protein
MDFSFAKTTNSEEGNYMWHLMVLIESALFWGKSDTLGYIILKHGMQQIAE